MPKLKVNDVELYYELHGEGPPLVLIAGLGAHLMYWGQAVEPLARRHRVLIYDHRGAGRSDAPPGPYSIPQMAADLIALLDALEIQRTDVLGHSMGGVVAMYVAAHHPERVRKLIPYSCAAVIGWPARRFVQSVERVWAECPDISSGALTRIFMPWSWSPKLLSDDNQVEKMVAMAEANPYKMSHASFRAQMQALEGFDDADMWQRIQAPARVLGGHYDLIAPLSQLQALAVMLNTQAWISEAGHNSHLEDPEWFVMKVLEFTAV